MPARGGAELVRALFEPLGWASVDVRPVALDERFPEWGDSRYVGLVLEGELRLADALRQLYVLLPVLDDAKHYWVAPDEVDKLLRAGDGWLAEHPEQKLITSRYLARRWSLTRAAMGRLELVRLAEADDIAVEAIDNAVEDVPDTDTGTDTETNADTGTGTGAEAGVPAAVPAVAEVRAEPSLAEQRRAAILSALRDSRREHRARPRLRTGPVDTGAPQGRPHHARAGGGRLREGPDRRRPCGSSWTASASGRPRASR